MPGLSWTEANGGSWRGELPVWPFDRSAPDGLAIVVPRGLVADVIPGPAYPAHYPTIYPLDPEPSLHVRTDHKWHVLPDGGLCLLQAAVDWQPKDSILELLLKACAWRVEYALMKLGLIEQMTEAGIVSDPVHDHLVPQAAQLLADENDANVPTDDTTADDA